MIFAEERLAQILPEIQPLWQAHWEETEMYRHGQKLNPDLKRLLYYNEQNYYRVYTARVDGRLVGNAGMYVGPDMHTQQLLATEDTWFLIPEYRVGWNALKFLKFVENEVKKLGARRIEMDAKLTNQSGRIMERRGYSHVANRYAKEF